MAKWKATKTRAKKESGKELTQFARIRHPKKRAFLSAFAKLGTVGRAAKLARIDRHTHANWLKEEGEQGDLYRQAFADATDEAGDIMEAEARRRAVDGVEKPVFGSLGQGQGSGEVGRVQEYSDTLLIFLLKGARPEKFRERSSTEISGPGGKPLETITTIQTVTHDDWYGNANRLPAPGNEPPGENPPLPGPA
ncbi:MAG: hypothetical protein WCY09_07955 [Candidatus Omnitrophota bacterium]